MEPASTIISKFGGVSTVAAIAGVHRTRVWNWSQPKEKGGTGGFVPMAHIPKLLAAAAAKNIELSAEDFIPLPTPSRQPEAGAATV